MHEAVTPVWARLSHRLWSVPMASRGCSAVTVPASPVLIQHDCSSRVSTKVLSWNGDVSGSRRIGTRIEQRDSLPACAGAVKTGLAGTYALAFLAACELAVPTSLGIGFGLGG